MFLPNFVWVPFSVPPLIHLLGMSTHLYPSPLPVRIKTNHRYTHTEYEIKPCRHGPSTFLQICNTTYDTFVALVSRSGTDYQLRVRHVSFRICRMVGVGYIMFRSCPGRGRNGRWGGVHLAKCLSRKVLSELIWISKGEGNWTAPLTLCGGYFEPTRVWHCLKEWANQKP